MAKWKILKGENKTDYNVDPIKEIQKEQKLVLQYFTLKLQRDAGAESKHAVKANCAILHLILERIYFETSRLKPENRPNFNLVEKITAYCDELQETKEALTFNGLAYGNAEQKQAHSRSVWKRLRGILSAREQEEPPPPVANAFMEKLKAALELDGRRAGANAAVSSEILTNFVDEVNNRTKLLNPEQMGNGHDMTITAKLMRAKINIIQNSLSKPFSDEGRYIGRFNEEYLPARARYRAYKYDEIKKYATAQEQHNGNKELYQQAVRLDQQVAAWKQTENERQSESARQSADDRDGRNLAMRARLEAMDSSPLEKLSYLVPSAVLWIFYALATPLCPVLTYISLSWRVSQNILLIGSATHLFVQSFFRGATTDLAVRYPLPPDRVTAV